MVFYNLNLEVLVPEILLIDLLKLMKLFTHQLK